MAQSRSKAATAAPLAGLAEVSAAVESGAGLPEIARAVGRALDASVAIIDASSSVLAVACASPEDERTLLSDESDRETHELRVADAAVGRLLLRPRGETPPDGLVRMVVTLIGLEVERSRGPERASEEAVGAFLEDLLGRRVTDRENIVARGHELGADLSDGASAIVVKARPQQPESGDWRARVLTIAARGARGVARDSLAAIIDGGESGDIVVVVPGSDFEYARRAVRAMRRELEMNLSGYSLAIGRSRPATDPVDVHRAGAEARLAANIAEARGETALNFEETGAYRLLLPAMSDNPSELQRFHEETVAPLVAYDEQYETELVRTLETFLDSDGNVANTAQKLFTHRHTVRYRLERVKELTGLDVQSTEGRERLGLGLKAMRVLGIMPPEGPAAEPGAEAGRVPREEKDR